MKAVTKKLITALKRLHTQLFLAYFVTLSLFSIIILTVILVVVQNMVVAQIGSSRLEVLQQIAQRANIIKTSSVTISSLYSYDENLQHLILESGGNQNARDYLTNIKTKYDAVFNDVGISYEMIILNDNFKYASTQENYDFTLLTKQLWYRHLYTSLILANDQEVQFSRTFTASPNVKDKKYAFAAGRLIESGDKNTILLLIIDEERLAELYSSVLSNGSNIYIFDKDGYIISHSDKKMQGKQFINVENMQKLYGIDNYSKVQKLGNDYLLSTYYDEQTGWTIVEEINTNEIFGVLYAAYNIMGVTLAACLLVAVVVSYYMSVRVSRPLKQLSQTMDRFGSEAFERLYINSGTEEIDHLSESFNHMAGEIFALMNDINVRSKQKRILEMNFLRAQINPHFLYNTLFSIRCMVEINKNKQAVEMISAFTDLLKKTLSVESTVVRLQEEIESTRKYLILQKIRYGNDISFEFDIASDTNSCFVPPLILQPIIENAIFHGIEAKKTSGTIVVSSFLCDDDVVIIVCDDGAGMDKNRLLKVQDSLLQEPTGKGSSIGIANVNNRIRLNEGEKYGITIDSTEGIGTTVTIRMKAQFVAKSSEVVANNEDIDS